MTIYFNPRYDSSVFLTAADCGLGKAYCGKEALLAELELRAGLTRACAEHPDRVIAYMAAMKKTLSSPEGKGLFYAESFERDDYATADLMLGWRDALVKAGWKGNQVGDSEKIRVLSLIEAHFDCPGNADGWRVMLEEAKRRPILTRSDHIEVQCRKKDLEPVLRDIFDAMNSHHAEPVVTYHAVAQPEAMDGKASVANGRILEFANEYAAHEWIAAQEIGCEDVVAEADGALLGDLLHAMGKPGIGAADQGIGAVMRLLPLGLALFKYPADISSLQSYLQSPRTPLGKLHTRKEKEDGTAYFPRAARQLFDHICSEGGFGAGWDKILDDARYAFDGTPLKDRDRGAALKFLGMWEQSKGLPAGEAPVEGVVAFVDGLARWAQDNADPDGEYFAQFQALLHNCGTMLRLLESWEGQTIPLDKVCRWAGHVCVPINISSDYARLGSMNVIRNVADIFSEAGHLVWFASTTENGVAYEYEFLSPGEISALQSAGVLIPGKEQMARLDRAYKLEGLSRCSAVTIVTCRRISGVETVQSALLAELSDGMTKMEGSPVAKTESGSVSTDPGKAAVHHFDPTILNGFSREKESYSSINTLLMSPVDYLLDYVKGYRQYGIEEVADINTTEGTVAHAYIEALGAEGDNDPKAMLKLHQDRYETLLDSVLAEKGLVLYLEENSLEEKSFRIGLKKSIGTLLGIIIENGLSIEGFEYELTADIEGIGPVYAKIDCLLKDPSDGRYVIFDFKYSASKTYYRKIEENRELQLAVYRKVVEKELGEVKFIGYYAIPRRKLYTPNNTLKDNLTIEEVEQADPKDIFDMAVKGYMFRWSQLRQGILEEGEGLPLADLDYFQDPDVFELESDYDNHNLKARAYGDKNITLKGGLK